MHSGLRPLTATEAETAVKAKKRNVKSYVPMMNETRKLLQVGGRTWKRVGAWWGRRKKGPVPHLV